MSYPKMKLKNKNKITVALYNYLEMNSKKICKTRTLKTAKYCWQIKEDLD